MTGLTIALDAANLTCLCVTARRQEELGYGG